MRWSTLVALFAAATAALISSHVGDRLQAQTPIIETKGFPPRAAATDYPVHAQAGTVTIGADFTGHDVGTQEGILTTDEFVVVEAGVYGPPGARLTLSNDDFSLRVNGSKKTLPSQPSELVTKSLKDPDYVEPESNKSSKTVVNTGGKQDGTDPNAPPPALIPIPFEVRRGWQQRVKRDSMEIGDRALPQAGLLFFQYSGGAKGIRSAELIYSGPAGKATLPLPHHP
ncbi:MAG TPA: hypothetical protein VGG72_27500 [Bryobacteraceae bacterium]|jgi:hypothetical protein